MMLSEDDDFDWNKFTDMDRDILDEERQKFIEEHNRMVEGDD